MERTTGPETHANGIPMAPAGAVALSEERMRDLKSQWEATYATLRQMDKLELGETEPVTCFVWRSEEL